MEICLFSSALPGWDTARVAHAAAGAGVTAVEWGIGPAQAVGSPREAAALEGLGVEAAGICVQGGAASLTAPVRLRPFAALAARLGAPHVRVFASAFRERRRARDGLVAAAETAAEHGVALLVEASPGTTAPSTPGAGATLPGRRDARLAGDRGRSLARRLWRPPLASHLGGRPSLALLRRETDVLRALVSR